MPAKIGAAGSEQNKKVRSSVLGPLQGTQFPRTPQKNRFCAHHVDGTTLCVSRLTKKPIDTIKHF